MFYKGYLISIILNSCYLLIIFLLYQKIVTITEVKLLFFYFFFLNIICLKISKSWRILVVDNTAIIKMVEDIMSTLAKIKMDIEIHMETHRATMDHHLDHHLGLHPGIVMDHRLDLHRSVNITMEEDLNLKDMKAMADIINKMKENLEAMAMGLVETTNIIE